jgi:group I intron endonuclease
MRVIYKITNNINGKIYIGKDSKNRKSYMGSGQAIKNAIKKYGIENFSKDIIDSCNSLDELNEKEKRWISYYKSYIPDIGYNRSIGGEGNWDLSFMTEEYRLKMKQKQLEYWNSEKCRSKKKEDTLKYFSNPENRKKQSELIKKFWKNTDQEFKEEVKKRLEKMREKRWSIPGEREKASLMFKINNPAYNPEFRKRMSLERIGKNNPVSKECIIDGVEYDCIKDAMDKLNLTRNQIQYRLKSKNFNNYNYK